MGFKLRIYHHLLRNGLYVYQKNLGHLYHFHFDGDPKFRIFAYGIIDSGYEGIYLQYLGELSVYVKAVLLNAMRRSVMIIEYKLCQNPRK